MCVHYCHCSSGSDVTKMCSWLSDLVRYSFFETTLPRVQSGQVPDLSKTFKLFAQFDGKT
jgi:hypothetical protein